MDAQNFQIINGTRKILISAPHAFAHKRPSLSSSYKQEEMFTAEMVKEACSLVSCWGIYLNDVSLNYDPNFHKLSKNPYKQMVKEIIEKEKIQLFIDIHGLSDKYDYDFGFSYCKRFEKSKRYAIELMNRIASKDVFNGVNFNLGYMKENDQETLTEFVCKKRRVPAFQVEIARYIRKDLILRKSITHSIAEFIANI